MRKILIPIFGVFFCLHGAAQVTCMATGSSGSGYTTFLNAGFEIENPDCEHTSFGTHITQIFDTQLDRNVFVFHSHIEDDNDRCQVFDRVRMEVKGGPNTDEELQHPENSTSYYRWKFRLDENFIGASSFNHIFQNKAKGGNDDAMPIITITTRSNVIEVNHRGGDTGIDLGVLAETDLELFKGKWIEAYFKQTHSENGVLEISFKDMATGLTLLEYANTNIDLWRTNADYNRPKWGMYRLKNSVLQDEEIRLSDFCISEIDSMLCPAEAVLVPDTIAPTAPANLMATNISMNIVDLVWEESNDVYGVTAYDLIQDGNFVQTTSNTFITINNLNPGTTYTFNVLAKDAAGNISQSSNFEMVTTDAATVLPDEATNPFPADEAIDIGIDAVLNWQIGNNTDGFQIFFGTESNPPLVGTQSNNVFQPELNPSTSYFWKVVAVNANGETSSPIWTFTTGVSNPDFPWLVYRANDRPEVETNFLVLNEAPVSPPVNEIVNDPNGSDNSFFGFRSNNSEKFRWRHDFSPTDSVITIVARLNAVDPMVNGICYFEVRSNGWRQKIRINQSTLKLERTSPVVEIDLPFDWVQDMHLIRIVSDGTLTSVYLDESPIPFASGISDSPDANTYFEWGNSGGIDYGAYIDWLAIDKTGGYLPNEGVTLPSDLFLSSIATLSSITLDGSELDIFSPNIFDYVVEVTGNEVPSLTWTTTSNLATVITDNPTTVPNTQATIEVTAQDGFTQQLYTLNYLGTTNLKYPELGSLIKVFPNPTPRNLQIVLAENQKGVASIFNSTGQKIRNDILINGETNLDLIDFSAGIYVLMVKMQDERIFLNRFTITE